MENIKTDSTQTEEQFTEESDATTQFTSEFDDMFGNNAIRNIFKTSQVITEKYQDILENGDMSIESIVSSLTNLANPSHDGSSDIFNNIFSRQNVDRPRLDEMKEFYSQNQNFYLDQNQLGEMN